MGHIYISPAEYDANPLPWFGNFPHENWGQGHGGTWFYNQLKPGPQKLQRFNDFCLCYSEDIADMLAHDGQIVLADKAGTQAVGNGGGNGRLH